MILSDEIKFKRLCENEMRWCLYTVCQLSMLISIYENEILTGSVIFDFSILSVNCSHLCIIYVKIFEKILSGGLEVSFSILSVP